MRRVSLLTNSMGVEGTASPEAIIAAVQDAGYGASLQRPHRAAGRESSADEEPLEDHADTDAAAAIHRGRWAFCVLLMYFSMGHMMWSWPLPAFLENNHVAMGLIQLLLTIIIMVINKKFFISGTKGLIKGAPNMDTLVALGAGAAFVYSTYALFAMTDAQMNGDMQAVMGYMHELYYESAAMILTLITVGKMLEARSKGKTTDAIKGLMKLAPKTANVLREGEEVDLAHRSGQKGRCIRRSSGREHPRRRRGNRGHAAPSTKPRSPARASPRTRRRATPFRRRRSINRGFLKC